MTRSVATLVYGDLAAASQEILARRELDLHWALTMEEALAVSRRVPIELVLTSDPFALPYLKERESLSRKPPCIVVHAGDADAGTYEAAGASALVSSADALVSAVSELTGFRFRTAERVPIQTVVDVLFKGDNHFLQTFDLSASGIGIHDLPHAKYGDRARVTLDLLDPPMTLEAMVVRTFHRPRGFCAGLCFTSITEEEAARISAIIEAERSQISDLATGDLPAAEEAGERMPRIEAGVDTYVDLLRDAAADLPGWLASIARDLTPSERAGLAGRGPVWAVPAVKIRIDLMRRLIADEDDRVDPSQALELCHGLAVADSPEQAVDAAAIRARVLRAIYALHKKSQTKVIEKA